MNANVRTVVCATDFSLRATEAATVAAKIALAQSGSICLVHVADAHETVAVADAQRSLQSAADTLRKSGVTVEPRLLRGADAAGTFVDFVRDETPGLVVVAAAGKSPLDRWAFGSFSERVAQLSTVPTLVVRDPAPFSGWSWTENRLNIFAALDLKTDSVAVLLWLKSLSSIGPYNLLPCHVTWRPRPVEESLSAAPELRTSERERLERELKKQVRDNLGADFPKVDVRATYADVASCLVEAARESDAHLIVVGTHQRRGLSLQFHGSVSRALLRESGMNVLCIPTAAKFDPREAHIPEFRRVLVATDLSELGNAAVPYACAVCSTGGVVEVVHVAPPRGALCAPRSGDPPELRDRLLSLIPNESIARCQPLEVAVLESSDVSAAICEEAERFGADVVCLSSHGLGVSRLLHGSVTKAVLNHIRRPVFVLRRPEA